MSKVRMLFWGHCGNVQKLDSELVHVSPTRSREMSAEFSKIGFDVTAAVFWPHAEKELSETLRYKHIDKINASDYDIVFCHLILSIQQISDLARGVPITEGAQSYGNDYKRFQKILDHPRIYLQLDAPRPLNKNDLIDKDLVGRLKAVGVATQNAVMKWKHMYSVNNVEWVNAATIGYRYDKGPTSPYEDNGRAKIIYLGRMNDASAVTPLEKLHHIAERLPEYDFHVVTNKIRDAYSDKVYAINELQAGHGRESRFLEAGKLIKLPNVFLHRGSTYDQSFNWLHYASCALGFAVRPNQDVASCKTLEYYSTGVPVVIEEGTPEAWILKEVANGLVAKHLDWDDFANKIKTTIQYVKEGKFKRRKMRHFISIHHGYSNRARQWADIMERYK